MAPAISRSVTAASSVASSLPHSSSFSLKNNNKAFNLRNAFLPQIGTRSNSFSCSVLKWKLERRESRVVVRCEAAAVAEKEVPESSGEKYEYQAEVTRLLDLIVHSLYSNKDIFLRELVSNASDALDKLRFLSVTEPSLLGDAGDLEIRIKPDPDNGTVTIRDTGIGMTKQELIDCLGTIAQSGTSKFLSALKENKDLGADNGLIGQFGVGFYSAFLVAEKVVVSTKSPKSDKQYVWEAAADSSSYVIREESDPEKLLSRGTEIVLYLRPDDKYEFSEPTKIQNLVKNYSQFVSFPIYTWQEKSRTVEVEEEEEPKEGEEVPEGGKKKTKKSKTEKYWDWELANETKPIWMRSPKEVEKDEYQEFYKKTFNEFLDPLTYTHFTTEGEVEFRSVLYIPGMAPLNNEDVVNPKTKNIHLYVKRVFISDDFDGELFPRYLSFVKGVVDSNDLPFNVSREILQESRIVRIMRKRLVGKAFDMIQDLAESENKEKRSEQMKAIWASTNKRPHNGGARPFAAQVEEYKKKGEQAPHAKTYIDMYKKFDLKGMSWVQQASDEVVASLMVSMPPIEDTSDGSSSASVIAPLRLPVDVEIRVMEKVVGPSRGTRVLGLGSGVAKQPKRRGSSQAEPKNVAVEEKLTRLRAHQKELEVRFQQKERDRERERQDREKDSEREQQQRKRDRERERQDREKDREREQEERERDRKRERQDREKDREREQEERERDRERERQDREKDRERE